MAEARRPWRAVFGWLVSLAIVSFAISDWGADDDAKQHATTDDEETVDELRILSISDGEVNPGDAVVIKFAGGDPKQPVEARVAKQLSEIVSRAPDSVVVRIPADTPTGRAALRINQGAKRSKAWHLHVRATNYRKLVAKLIGGLALFVLGLSQLATGIRGLAGSRLRTLLGRLTVSPPRAIGVGALVGAGTQLTSSAAAFTVSLVEAKLLAVAPAVAVLVGAQLGASLSGALLPVPFAREGLLLVALGVLWMRIASSPRRRAVANAVLGAGLMLYGLHLLQTSVEPLVSDPKILPYLGYLSSPGVMTTLTCAAVGAVLAFVLQGVGPVYVLVVGVAQTTTLPLANALAILAGTSLGAALGMAVVAWQAGTTTRPLARTQLLFGAAAALFVLVTIPVWTSFAHVLVGGDELAYGHNVLRTRAAGQVALGFALAQVAAVGFWIMVLPALARRATQVRSRRVEVRADITPRMLDRELSEVLERLQGALAIGLETSRTGERTRSGESEKVLVEARQTLEARYKAIAADQDTNTLTERSARSVVAVMQLRRAVEQAVHAAELCVERGVKLGDDAKQRLVAMHAIVDESFDAMLAALTAGAAPDLEDAGAREIRLNALESEGRTASIQRRRVQSTTSSLHIGIAELVDSYENVGNHLFRVAKALAEDADGL